MDRIRNVYKGKDSERYYDAEICLTRGEERALMRTARAAGTVSMHWTATLAAILSLAMLAFIFGGGHKAYAHDPQTHQADSLSEARSKMFGSCCIGDDYQKIRVENWETTDNGWRVLYHGQWLDVPKLAKVSNMTNPDGEAKAWIFNAEAPYVRCFMPGTVS